MEDKKVPICHFKHHKDTYGKPISCKECGRTEGVKCGPFIHACPDCNKGYFRNCIKCGKPVWECYC